MNRLSDLVLGRPKSTLLACLLLSGLLLPLLWWIRFDTDPRHVFPAGSPELAEDRRLREEFHFYDFVTVAIENPGGAFNPDTLNRFFHASQEIKRIPGVMPLDVYSPENVEDIQQGKGDIATTPVSIVKLQTAEIHSQEEADAILARIRANPVLQGKLASDDGKVLTLFVAIDPAEASSVPWDGWLPPSWRALEGKFVPAGAGRPVAREVERICRKYLGPGERLSVGSLPVFADGLGEEMVRALVLLLPAELLLLWVLVGWAFHDWRIAIPCVLVAALSSLWGLALLICLGWGVQPLTVAAVLYFQPLAAMGSLPFLREVGSGSSAPGAEGLQVAWRAAGRPLLVSTLVEMAAFGSLLLCRVPQLRSAGLFVCAGALASFVLSLGIVAPWMVLGSRPGRSRLLAKPPGGRVVMASIVGVLVLGAGLFRSRPDDDPTHWIRGGWSARDSEDRINQRSSGTHYDYLTIEGGEEDQMKEPALLRFLEATQRELEKSPIVRATTAIPDVVKKVRYELFNDPAKNALPDRKDEAAQMLFVYEISGGNPDKIFHLVTTDYSKAAIWIQMNSQDQAAVREVTGRFERFRAAHPLPPGLTVHWTGTPYLGAESERQMAFVTAGWGLALSWLVCGALLLVHYRSAARAGRAMLPAIATLVALQGALAWAGYSYDVTLAVLAPLILTVGLTQTLVQRTAPEAAVVFAIAPAFLSGLAGPFTLGGLLVAAVVLAFLLAPLAATRDSLPVESSTGGSHG